MRDAETYEEYPILCITGRRIPVYFHSEHRQLPWCRELWPGAPHGDQPGDSRRTRSGAGRLGLDREPLGQGAPDRGPLLRHRAGTINCEHQWWYPELAQADKGFKLSCINCIVDRTAQDKYNGSSTVRGYPVKVYKATPENSPFGNPVPCGNERHRDHPRLVRSAPEAVGHRRRGHSPRQVRRVRERSGEK